MNRKILIFSKSLGLLLIMALSSTTVFSQRNIFDKSVISEVSIQEAIPCIKIVESKPKPRPVPPGDPKPGPLYKLGRVHITLH